MIDWIKVKINLLHEPLNGGLVVKTCPDGEVIWSTACHIQAIGSYESTVSIKSDGGDGQGRATFLWISGNPSKFLQGHNVFGSDDVLSLVFDMFKVIAEQFGLNPSLSELMSIYHGQYEITMIDINYMFELQSYSDVKTWLRTAQYTAKSRHGTPTTKGGTIYFGKNSKRWAIKAYSKYEELKKSDRKLPEELDGTQLFTWSENKLRIELRLLNRELQDKDLRNPNNWKLSTPKNIFEHYMRKIDMTTAIHLRPETLKALPTSLHSTYLHWKDGRDLRGILPKTTYYNHRKKLAQYGIHIDILPLANNKDSNIVPMVRFLEAKPAAIPSWAFSQGLVHSSAIA